MKLSDLKSILRSQPCACPRFHLPNGDQIPVHFHITEVGHVTKRFIDCGGVIHDGSEICLLQAWLGQDVEHRLNADTFAKILDLGAKVLPHDDLQVEVEYDDGIVSQYPITGAEVSGDRIELRLEQKQTDCLARQRLEVEGSCGNTSEKAEPAAACC
jgi:hypothetical protein